MRLSRQREFFVDVGVDYCLTHNGIRDCDQDICDFADRDPLPGEQVDCVLRPLGYKETPPGRRVSKLTRVAEVLASGGYSLLGGREGLSE